MISAKQANIFLEEVLEMPRNWKDILETDKLEFLRLFMRHHAVRVPFQNISMAAIDQEKRFNPDEATIVKIGLSGKGGCCLILNYFAKILLKALGLDASAIIGTHSGAPVEGTHCMVIVTINNKDTYLVEVGGSFPILEPVPMDKNKLPFRILASGGFPYEFREISDGIIGRFHIGGGLISGKYTDKEEALRTSWDLTPRDLSVFEYPMSTIFTMPEKSVLLRQPYMCRFFSPIEYKYLFPESENETIIKNGNNHCHLDRPSDFVFIFRKLIIIGDAFQRKMVTQYDSYDDMAQDVKKYFPTLGEKEILQAFENFDKHDIGPSPYDKILLIM